MSLAATLTRNLRKLAQADKPTAYRLFELQLKQRIPLSPSMTRLVFTGPDVGTLRTLAPDQRVKLLIPAVPGQPLVLPGTGDWRKAVRDLPDAQRPLMRTYTIRNLRSALGEVDVDFVLHGETGPASAWATHAQPGDRLHMAAPNALFTQDCGGYEWQPPAGMQQVLLIGDETALPAIAGILEELARQSVPPQVQAYIEVPHGLDALQLTCPADAQVVWLPRDTLGLRHGEGMVQAAKGLASLPTAPASRSDALPLQEVDIDTQILWELAQPAGQACYAWVAGESGAVMNIRRYWVGELGLDRRALTFMGYWREGRALD